MSEESISVHTKSLEMLKKKEVEPLPVITEEAVSQSTTTTKSKKKRSKKISKTKKTSSRVKTNEKKNVSTNEQVKKTQKSSKIRSKILRRCENLSIVPLRTIQQNKTSYKNVLDKSKFQNLVKQEIKSLNSCYRFGTTLELSKKFEEVFEEKPIIPQVSNTSKLMPKEQSFDTYQERQLRLERLSQPKKQYLLKDIDWKHRMNKKTNQLLEALEKPVRSLSETPNLSKDDKNNNEDDEDGLKTNRPFTGKSNDTLMKYRSSKAKGVVLKSIPIHPKKKN